MATSERDVDGSPLGDYPELLEQYNFTFAGSNDYFGFRAVNPSASGVDLSTIPFYFMRSGNQNLLADRIASAAGGGGFWSKSAILGVSNVSYSFCVNIGDVYPSITDVKDLGYSLRRVA